MGHHHLHQHHDHHDHHGHHHHHSGSGSSLLWALMLTLSFALVEVVYGFIANSLALLGDAGHMVSDSFALALAAFAAWLARRKPSDTLSYGFARAEVLAGLVNSLLMLAVVISIALAAWQRFHQPAVVAGETVIKVAFVGLLINVLVAWVLMRGEQNLNVRGALLHVMGDLLGSVAALASGVLILYKGWYWADPLLSVLICALILLSTLRLLKDIVHVMMEGVPSHLDYQAVGESMAAQAGVSSVHDLHIWTLGGGTVILSAHVIVEDMQHWNEVLDGLQHMLHDAYQIEHITLQPECNTQVLHHMPDAYQQKTQIS